jgi:hypothetical protein
MLKIKQILTPRVGLARTDPHGPWLPCRQRTRSPDFGGIHHIGSAASAARRSARGGNAPDRHL